MVGLTPAAPRRGARTTWIIIGGVLIALVVAFLALLPLGVRSLAVRQVEAMTGRQVDIADVDLNLFTRHLVLEGFRIRSPGQAPPLVVVPRVEARFHLLELARGHVHLDRVALFDPTVHLARTADGALSAADVVERWAARPAGEPVRATLELLQISRGRIVLEDRAVDPDRRWVLEHLALEARDIVTVADAATGRASATFLLAGAPATLDVEDLRVRPVQARASLQVDGLDVAPAGAYIPGAALRLARGQLSTRLRMEYDGRGFVRAGGEAMLRDVALERPGQDAPFVAVPALAVSARDITYTGGALTVTHLSATADEATVLDAAAPRARPLEVRAIRFQFAEPTPAAAGPGRITLAADLPGDGRLEARGTGELLPLTANLGVELSDLDVALARIWLPPDAAVLPAAGKAAASLALRYGDGGVLAVSGRAHIAGLDVARRGQSPPLLHDDRVAVTVRDLVVAGGRVALGRVEVVGSPTLVDGRVAPAQRFHLPRVTLTAAGGGYPGPDPTRVAVRASLPRGGRVEADGTVRLATQAASLNVAIADADLLLSEGYLPPEAPVTLRKGRLDAEMTVLWRDALEVDGRLTARDLLIGRRGQAVPFIEHPKLDASITDLVVRGGELSLARLTLAGTPTIVDATANPPQRFETRSVDLAVSDLTWPGRRPARVEGHAVVADGGTSTLHGTIHPATQAVEVRAEFDDVDVTRARGYLPAGVPLVIDDGRARATVVLHHTRGGGVRIDAEGAVRDVALRLTAEPGVRVRDERLSFEVDDLTIKDAAFAVARVAVQGTPVLSRGGEAASAFRRLHAEMTGFAWPAGAPAGVALVAELPEAGQLQARGTFAPATRALDARLDVDDAALGPLAALLIAPPAAGRVDAHAEVQVRPGPAPAVTARGDVAARDVRVGPADAAPVRVAAVRVEGAELSDGALRVARLALQAPAVLVEREKDGTFPLRAMLRPDDSGQASPGERAGALAPAAAEKRRPLTFRIGEFTIQDGTARFLDRTTTPAYSEEITRLAVSVRDLTNAGDQRAALAIQGIVGTDAALDLRGEVAPFAHPFFLEVAGELNDFSVPRTNPYLRRFLDWIARRGELTTTLRYRVVGRELSGTNELLVQRLDVEPARGGVEADKVVGLPIGLAVALLKGPGGDIRFTLPVTGELGSPRFSFGDAIRSALRNVLGRLVTAPFRAIGSVFSGEGGEVSGVAIDPVTFEAASAVIAPEAARHLQRVADFLRASPYVRLALEPVVGQDDLRALRAQEVTARIQRVQREQGVGFAEAARRVYRTAAPGTAPPRDVKAIIGALTERQPAPADAARRLAERRASVVRAQLVDAAGIEGARLVADPHGPVLDAAGAGRVEFSLQPAS